MSKDRFSRRHQSESKITVRVDLVSVAEDGDVVQEVLPTLQTADRVVGRSERDLSWAAAEIERDKAFEHVLREDVQLLEQKKLNYNKNYEFF